MPTVQVDIGKAENRQPPFLAKNPLGGLPVLELDDGTCIAESVAICRYFEELHPEPPLLGTDAKDRALVEMWQRRMELELFRNVDRLLPEHARLLQGPHPAGAGVRRGVQRRRARSASRGSTASSRGRPFVAGERYTIADITALCASTSAA